MRKVWQVIIFLNLLGLLVFVSTQLWWTGTGYCIGSFLECNL